jgi:hypothetical protein
LTHSPQKKNKNWEDALQSALRGRDPREDGDILFHEEREDLAITLDGEGDLQELDTWWSGLAAQAKPRGERHVYRSAPVPEDAARLLRIASDPAQRFPRPAKGAGGPTEASSFLSSGRMRDHVTALAGAIARISPGARSAAGFAVRGVAFEQRIIVARPGLPPARDRRRGMRLWAETRLSRGGLRSSAVVELVLDLDDEGTLQRLESAAHYLVSRAEARLGALDPPKGEIPIVFAPGVGGILIHELVGHALEADTVLAGQSWLAGSDTPLPPSGLMVIDDPRRGRAPWRVDDEGEEARVVSLLRGGRVAGELHDRTTAAISERQTNGHGRRSSFREPVRPRMGCTFVAAGPLKPQEVVADVSEAIYVRRMEAGTTETRTGRSVFRVTDADRLRDGAIDAPLKPHVMIVDGPRALPTMNRIADDLVFDACVGSCHRDGQPLATSVGAPTFWIGLGAVCG